MTHAVHPAHLAGAAGFAASTCLWFVMMAVMMAPTVSPWVRAYARFGDGSPLWFASGYLVAWFGYSAAAAAVQIYLHAPASLAPAAFLLAGVYQLTPFKRACLTHCRNPFGYLLARWRRGPSSGFRIGVAHGIYCIGCCWALMATMLGVGLASAWWMLALAAIALVEQAVPHGDALRVPLGVALIATAAAAIGRMWLIAL